MTDTENKLNLDEIRVEEKTSGSSREYRKHRRRKHRRKNKKKKILKILLAAVILAVIGACLGVFWMLSSGKSALQTNSGGSVPVLEEVLSDGTKVDLEVVDENTISYEGKNYHFNENMINILLLGIDTLGDIQKDDLSKTGNGQADVIVLASMDPEAGTVTLIPINRDTMTRVAVNDRNGKFLNYATEQIAVAYAYGKDEKQSAKLMQDAVSYLFNGLPIHGYITVNISAIPVVNDLVGSVEVVLPEDFVEEFGDGYVKGASVKLKGDMAETYVRKRYGIADSTNTSRMIRQREYFFALANKAIAQTKTNLTLPITIYQALGNYMVTNIGMSEFAYLATQVTNCHFTKDSIREIPGTVKDGKLYQEFYVDEKGLYELMLDVYYSKLQ